MDAKTFLLPKLELARRLEAGDCGGNYDDAILILSSMISSLAADFWPGKGIDRARFTELWARFGGKYGAALNVSVPLLAQRLHEVNDASSLCALKKARPRAFSDFPASFDTLVVYDETVDMTESEALSVCPSLDQRLLREYMYPTVFYEQVRSGLSTSTGQADLLLVILADTRLAR